MMYHLLYLDIKQYTWDKEGEGGQINPPTAFPGFQVPSRYKVKLTGEFFIFFGIFFCEFPIISLQCGFRVTTA